MPIHIFFSIALQQYLKEMSFGSFLQGTLELAAIFTIQILKNLIFPKITVLFPKITVLYTENNEGLYTYD